MNTGCMIYQANYHPNVLQNHQYLFYRHPSLTSSYTAFTIMVIISKLTNGLVAATLLGVSMAHPGEHHDHEAIERSVRQREALARNTRRSLDGCAQNVEHKALTERSIARREDQLDKLRQKRGLEVKPQKYRRDLATLQEFETGKIWTHTSQVWLW
jgi:hypothetical protein